MVKLLTEREVSDLTGIPIATLRTKRSRPGSDPIPFFKAGRIVMYPAAGVSAWIERNTFASTADYFDKRKDEV